MSLDLFELMSRLEIRGDNIKKSIGFFDGDKNATIAVINSTYLEIGHLKRTIETIKELTERRKQLQEKEAFYIQHMNERISSYNTVLQSLPTRMTQENRAAAVKVGKENAQTKKTSSDKNAPSSSIPTLKFATMDQFENIPKYMKGRLSYDGLNTAIEEYNSAIKSKYEFLKKGFPATGSMAAKKRYKEYRSQESKATNGAYFLVADDMRALETLKSETSRRTIFPILRHLQLTKEIRGPGPIVRFAVV